MRHNITIVRCCRYKKPISIDFFQKNHQLLKKILEHILCRPVEQQCVKHKSFLNIFNMNFACPKPNCDNLLLMRASKILWAVEVRTLSLILSQMLLHFRDSFKSWKWKHSCIKINSSALFTTLIDSFTPSTFFVDYQKHSKWRRRWL